MDAAWIATSSMKAVNFLPSSTTQRTANPTTLILSRHSYEVTKSKNALSFFSNSKNNSLSLTRCSTKSNINTEDQNSTSELDTKLESHEDTKLNSSDEPCLISPSSSSSSGGLVFDLGAGNSWDSEDVGSPVVKRFLSDEEERWYMWYYGRSNSNPGFDSIGLATSSNGVHWERGVGSVQTSVDVGTVMSCSKDWWAFDTSSIRPSEVVIMSSTKVRASSAVYWLYYTGLSSEEVDTAGNSFDLIIENPEKVFKESGRSGKIYKSLPGLAISQDGRYWARIEGEHHSGALFDVGSENEWDSLFIASPQVVFHGSGDLRMYYHSFDVRRGKFCIGIARSRDGIKWVKLGKIIEGGKSGAFDELGGLNACVVRNKKDGDYLMAYEGVSDNGGKSIGLAVSKDGLKDWTRLQDDGVLEASGANGWDSKEVGSPCLVQMDGEEDEWRMYYRGVGNGGRIGIGMAVSQGSDIKRFRRWTGGFHM
uniref:Arabinanase/levansucrase/invertase n=2 Tax=Cannabis sativa TaxID=3483 RepID=A0A803QJ49_CANSA